MLFYIAAIVLGQAKKPNQDVVRMQLQAIYDRYSALKMKRDADGLEKLTRETKTPDFQFFAKTGHKSLEELLKGMHEAMDRITAVNRATTSIESIKPDAKGVTVRLRTVFVFMTKPLEDKHPHVISEQILGEESWMNKNGKWQAYAARTVTEKFFRDGRAVR